MDNTPLLPIARPQPATPSEGLSLGLALGGGGARGLAHIAMLEACDELGVKPAIIAGTSIGSIFGAAYASGMTGKDINEYCVALFSNRTELIRRLYTYGNGSLWEYWNPFTPALFNAERLFQALLPELPATFAGLSIPLLTVATDFYAQSEVVIESGPLLPALAASGALPGLIKPVETGGRILIDGGFVNPLPFDHLKGRASLIAAVDVSAGPQQTKSGSPSTMEAILGCAQISLRSIIREKLKSGAPDILIRPGIGHYRVLDFYKIGELLKDAGAAKEELKRALNFHLDAVA